MHALSGLENNVWSVFSCIGTTKYVGGRRTIDDRKYLNREPIQLSNKSRTRLTRRKVVKWRREQSIGMRTVIFCVIERLQFPAVTEIYMVIEWTLECEKTFKKKFTHHRKLYYRLARQETITNLVVRPHLLLHLILTFGVGAF